MDINPRRWTATITVTDNPVMLGLGYSNNVNGSYIETVDADLSTEDLQRSQANAAYAEAAQYLLLDLGEVAHVQLYKTTKAHGTRKDHVTYTIDKRDATAWARKRIAGI